MGKLSKYAGAGLIWISQYKNKNESNSKEDRLPMDWRGNGSIPVVFFRSEENDPNWYYFAAKGGRSSHNHGNMDAGSFVFELNGVRWVIDPGTQNYYDVYKNGFDLWGMCQSCDRWKLMTKNNFGHSTLTVNEELFDVEGFVEIVEFIQGAKPEVTFNTTPLYYTNLKDASRTFIKEDNQSLLIQDEFITTDFTKILTWQLITTADVEIVKDGVILRLNGQKLKLEHISSLGIPFSVVSLDPPPLQLDKKIDGLKRIELKIPARKFEDGKGLIRVRLQGKIR